MKNNDIKYIYFEINEIVGIDSKEKTIENENVLLFKPNTNSDGYWIFRNMTERLGFSVPTFCIVTQYWIDLDKFDNARNPDKYLKKSVDIVMLKLLTNIRDMRINEILN